MSVLDHGFALWLVIIVVTLLAMTLFMPPEEPDGRRLLDVLRGWLRRRRTPTSTDSTEGDT